MNPANSPLKSALKIYDSARGEICAVEPVTPGHLGIYVCGATVQGEPHVGHMRSALAFDVLVRWARLSGWDVTYVRNVTDIDDKILAKSAEHGADWWAWAARHERAFARAYATLGCLPPDYEPHATGHITDQIALIEKLIERGHAYPDGQGNVYFDVHSLPDYGSLTHQKLEDLASTEDPAQVDAAVEAGKKAPQDFALWKAAKASEPETAAWDSPWGRGRPGWHLECSAMSVRYLGEQFDIHGGGLDLRFPHHENEQAQAHGAGWGFAKYWMHNAWVVIKGEKMSKSLGNSVLVSDLVRKVSAPVLRLALVGTHYRATVEYSPETVTQAAALWAKFTGFVGRAHDALVDAGVDVAELAPAGAHTAVDGLIAGAGANGSGSGLDRLPTEFVDAMNDDLNVAGAMSAVHAELKAGNAALNEKNAAALAESYARVRGMLDVFGLDPLNAQWVKVSAASASGSGEVEDALAYLVEDLLEQRTAARAAKNWAEADRIRDLLADGGITVEDSADGAKWHLG